MGDEARDYKNAATSPPAPPPPAPIPSHYRRYPTPDPHEDHTGPFYFDPESRGAAFVCSERACNSLGRTHGGALMTFADFALFIIAWEYTGALGGGEYVTISLSTDMVASGRKGDLIEAEGEVTKVTRGADLIFISVRVKTEGRTLLVGQGIIKRLAPAKL